MRNFPYLKKSSLVVFSFAIFSFVGSIYQGSYIYDGFHWGLISSNAQDLLNGKKPYKDFFVHYGFLTVLLQSISLKIYNSVYSILILSSLFYSVSIILLAKLIEKFLSSNYVNLFVFIIIFMQPFIVYPWHTYFIFFTSVFSLSLFLKKNSISLFLFGFFIQLGFLFSESYKIFSIAIILLSIIILFFENQKLKNIIKKIILILLGYLLPLIAFIIYLYLNNLIDYWLLHSNIPNIFVNELNSNIWLLILSFISNYIFESINIFSESYYILGILINLSCIFFLIKTAQEKKINLDLIFISCFSLLLNFMLVFRHESFRFFCGPIIGLVILFYFINNFKDFNKYLSILILLFIAIISNPFEKGNSNRNFTNSNQKILSYNDSSILKFRGMNFTKDTWEHHIKLIEILKKINNKCKSVEFFYNATPDHYYYLIASDYLNSFQKIPGYSETTLKNYYDSMNTYFDSNIKNLMIEKIAKKNIVLMREDYNNSSIAIGKTKINLDNFYFKNLPFSYNNKKKLLYIPDNCTLN